MKIHFEVKLEVYSFNLSCSYQVKLMPFTMKLNYSGTEHIITGGIWLHQWIIWLFLLQYCLTYYFKVCFCYLIVFKRSNNSNSSRHCINYLWFLIKNIVTFLSSFTIRWSNFHKLYLVSPSFSPINHTKILSWSTIQSIRRYSFIKSNMNLIVLVLQLW